MAEKAYVSKRGLQSTQTRLHRSAFAIAMFTVTLGGGLYRAALGDTVFVAVLGAALVWGAILFAVVRPERFKWRRLPAPVVLFVLYSALALIWAGATMIDAAWQVAFQVAIAVLAVMVAYLLTWQETLRTLATALRYLTGIGGALWVWQTYFDRVESPLAITLVLVIGLTVFAVQTAAGLVRPGFGLTWVTISAALILASGDPVAYAAVAVVLISLLFALWARRSHASKRMHVYWIGLIVLAATVAALLQSGPNFINITKANIWLDLWQSLGVVGFILFANLVFVTAWRVWFRAVDQPRRGAGDPLPYAASALWPFLVMMSLLVFSLLLGSVTIDVGWFLLVLFAVKTRFDYIVPAKQDDAKKLAWRNVPLTAS